MRNTTTLLLVTLLATVLSTLPSPTTAQAGISPWCRTYMNVCQDLGKINCAIKVPNNDTTLSWVTHQCSTVTYATGLCKYFSPNCSCSYIDVANMNQTVQVPLSQPALERTQAQTNNRCVDGNATSTALPTTGTATGTTTTGTATTGTATTGTATTGTATGTITPTTTTMPNMASDNKKPMAVSLATINVVILIALFL